ncbi:MAG: ABC transporter substrate-binding protein [Natronosporangium sp.]
MRTRLARYAAASSAMLLLAVTACGGDDGDGGSDVDPVATGDLSAAEEEALGGPEAVAAMQQLYQAATGGGQTEVTVYGPGEVDKEPVYEIFSQRFPGITVNAVYLVGPDYSAKLEGEVASGQHVADLVQAGDTSVSGQVGMDYFEDFDPVTAEGLDPVYQDPGGLVLGASATAFGYMYNTNLMNADETPAGWEELVDPTYRGQLASDDPTRFGGGFSTLSHLLWDGRFGADYIGDLSAQELHFESSIPAAGTAVATGQYALHPFYPLSFYYRDRDKGAPVDFVFPTEGGVHISPHYLGLMQGAPNPDAGKLLMTWLFSPEGQQAAADIGYYPLMPGAAGPEGYPSAEELDLLKPFPLADVNQIARDNLATVQAAFE